MSGIDFAHFTTLACSRKRTNLTGTFDTTPGLRCTPLLPVDTETRQRLELNTPHTVWEVHLQNAPDIRKGDKLVIGTVEYPVVKTEPYTWLPTGDTRVRVIIEDLRN